MPNETKKNSREWVHYPDTSRIFEQTFAGPVQVAQVVKVEDGPLVAAAPELLEALKAVEPLLGVNNACKEQVRKAIRKATEASK